MPAISSVFKLKRTHVHTTKGSLLLFFFLFTPKTLPSRIVFFFSLFLSLFFSFSAPSKRDSIGDRPVGRR